jgi:hypothetical protein
MLIWKENVDKATFALRPFLMYLKSLLIPVPQLSANYQQTHLAAKYDELRGEVAAEFCLRSISFILVGFFNML